MCARVPQNCPCAHLAADATIIVATGLAFYALLWTETVLFHARKHHVSYHMMRKYSKPLMPNEPCLIPGFVVLLPTLGAELAAHVTPGQVFPLFEPPDPLGDWREIKSGDF